MGAISDIKSPIPLFLPKFLDHRFHHRSICGGRGCLRKCLDHLEKTGRIEKQYVTPMIEGEQWEM
jgi:hypothetical protein